MEAFNTSGARNNAVLAAGHDIFVRTHSIQTALALEDFSVGKINLSKLSTMMLNLQLFSGRPGLSDLRERV
jgi:hypothetical protein